MVCDGRNLRADTAHEGLTVTNTGADWEHAEPVTYTKRRGRSDCTDPGAKSDDQPDGCHNDANSRAPTLGDSVTNAERHDDAFAITNTHASTNANTH